MLSFIARSTALVVICLIFLIFVKFEVSILSIITKRSDPYRVLDNIIIFFGIQAILSLSLIISIYYTFSKTEVADTTEIRDSVDLPDYQMQSNKLSDLHDMGIRYWDDWDIGDGTIGCRYGATVKRWNLREKLIDGLKKDPFGRRHIMNMWQEADFHDETGGTDKGLVPCCYETIWNVRKGEDGLYLDMLMNQRSSDYETSCAINEIQYIALQLMVAAECGYKPGVFTHVIDNVQIYDRHMEQAKTIIDREPVPCSAHLVLHGEGKHFDDFTIDDFEMVDYPLKEIKEENPQLEFELGI